MRQLGEPERLEQRRQVHPEPAAVALAQAVPAADRVVLGRGPSASTVPSAAGFCSSAAPRATQSPCALSQACRSSIARRWYFSWVEPTWQTSAGGSAASSRYIVYSDVPGAVLSSHGSSLVPLPIASCRSLVVDGRDAA